MKKRKTIFYYNVALLLLILLLVGCSDKTQEAKTDSSENASASQSEKKTDDTEESNLDKKEDKSVSTTESEKTATNDSNQTSSEETRNEESNNTAKSEEDNALSRYSSEEIEYARVWLELGVIEDVDELNVRHIPAGTLLNPEDETSASYPEDVIQLAGSRLVAGSVTYSGNGDGTINVYNVPLRWDGKNPAGEKFYTGIIENTKQVPIDQSDDEKIIELIKSLNVHH
ncbi:hypothetical protein [Halobacillus naozhouensis]|uniref:Lipoprotein n=1 Tax=Halobacillus naozhouensis TaxID=554880 RepID=A0ABY8IY71_9BACI|nr:hypothetical protein [Halobacillus naozhouensis]WFT74153.1 hypothetical protein P9989_17565 [Halobacillus naozhouensis]